MTGRARDAIDLPSSHWLQLCIRGPVSFVVIAPEGAKATPEAALDSGYVSVLFTHDESVSWPDRAGVSKADAFLEKGWIALLPFTTLADALACRTRLGRERVQ